MAVMVASVVASVPAGAEPVAVLLEKGIYTEETAGDLDGAIKIYQQIVDQASSNAAWGAEASYRLGGCYLKKGDTTNALAAFRFTASHATDTNIVATARKKIVEINWHPLALQKQPWADGEVTLYLVRNKAGQLQGAVENVSKTDRYEGRNVWMFDQRQLNPGYRQYVRVIADATNLLPILSFYNQGPYGTSKMFYERDRVLVKADVNGAVTNREADLDEAFYDADEIDNVIRGLPLTVGYKQRIPGFYVLDGRVYVDFEVTGREGVTVPAGSFQCFVLKCNASTRGAITMWISDDDHRYLVKTAYPRVDMELAKVEVDPGRTFVTNGMPDFEPLIQAFNQQKAREDKTGAAAQPQPLSLEPAPWQDGEVMRLDLKTAAGGEIGTMIWTANAETDSGRPAWRIEQRLFVTANNSEQFTRVIARKDSFAPVTGLTKNQLGRFDATYGDKAVELRSEAGGGKASQTIPVDRVVYDNEEALYLIRRLPLAEGYRASFPIFPVTGGSVVDCRIEVAGKETLTVPAGTFECLKVTLSVWAQNAKALEHHLWFSADAHKYLVRYDAGQTVMNLVEASQKKPGTASELSFDDLGISLTLPPEWFAYRNPAPGGYRFSLQFLPPELNSWAAMTAIQRTPDVTSARYVADHDINVLKGFFKNYTVRPDSWKSPATGDLQPVSYAADYDDQGKAMVEYRTYILGKATVYWFVFRADKGDFEAGKPVFDAVVAGFALPPNDRPMAASEADKLAAEKLTDEGWKAFVTGRDAGSPSVRDEKLREAQRSLEGATERSSDNIMAWVGLGNVHLQQNLPLNARHAFESALSLSPDNALALEGLGWAARSEGKRDEAITCWKKTLEQVEMPDEVRPLFGPGDWKGMRTETMRGLSELYLEAGNVDEAKKYAELWLASGIQADRAREMLKKIKSMPASQAAH